MTDRARWALVTAVLLAVLAIVIWLVAADAPIVRFVVRLYQDKKFLKKPVRSWGWLAPLVFIAIQALQVIISPIPGEITGPVGGALFGTWLGLIYSTIGLTIGTLFCFWVGRKWGEPLVRPWLSEHNWNRMNFILEAEGAIICFVLYFTPASPRTSSRTCSESARCPSGSSPSCRRSRGSRARGSRPISALTWPSSSTSTPSSSWRSCWRCACRSTTTATV